MPTKAQKARAAWIVTYQAPRPPFDEECYSQVEPGQPLAVFNGSLSASSLCSIVDAFVQSFTVEPHDLLAYLPPGKAPYAASVEGWGQMVIGGYNPYVEAFRVTDLRVVDDPETGTSRFEFTRRAPSKPRVLIEMERAEQQAVTTPRESPK